MPVPNFFFREEMTQYDFGPRHPLKPVRLSNTIDLLRAEGAVDPICPEAGTDADLLRVHSQTYVELVKLASDLPQLRRAGSEPPNELTDRLFAHGLGTGDNPIFQAMHERSLWYVGGAVACARAVVDGSDLSFNISGGLHHAHRDHASGFCVYNDPAVMVSILRERFPRVAYVDIDLHHGDGVQAIFYDDPTVMTVSIHESGETLFPGTGFVKELGTPTPHCVNIPLQTGTTGDVWLEAFKRAALPALRKFDPGAIVLQMGCDAHFNDPLGHLNVAVQEWLEAITLVQSLEKPIAACGGGGYELRNVARMWAAGCMSLSGHPFSNSIPISMQAVLEAATYYDPELPSPRMRGEAYASARVGEVVRSFA